MTSDDENYQMDEIEKGDIALLIRCALLMVNTVIVFVFFFRFFGNDGYSDSFLSIDSNKIGVDDFLMILLYFLPFFSLNSLYCYLFLKERENKNKGIVSAEIFILSYVFLFIVYFIKAS